MKKYFMSPDDPKLSCPKALIKVMKKVLGSDNGEINKFFYKAEFEYPNGEIAPFIFIGPPTGKWKEFLKSAKAAKDFAFGLCKLDEYGNLMLNVQKGKGKKAAFLKSINKTILKKAGGKIANFVDEISGPVVEETTEETSAPSSSTSETTEETTPKVDPKAHVDSVKKIIANFKDIRKEYNEDKADEILESLDDWVDVFESFKPAIQAKLKAALESATKMRKEVEAWIAQDEKIISKIEKIITYIEEWDEMEDHSVPEAKIQEQLILRKLAKVKPMAQEINDKEALEAIESIESAFNV